MLRTRLFISPLFLTLVILPGCSENNEVEAIAAADQAATVEYGATLDVDLTVPVSSGTGYVFSDASDGQNDLTYVGGTPTVESVDGHEGLRFTGSSYLTNEGSGLNVGDGSFSIEFSLHTTTTGKTLFDKRAASGVGYHAIVYQGNVLFQMNMGTQYLNYYTTTGTSVIDGQWHDVRIDVERNAPDGVRLYVDGVLQWAKSPAMFLGANLDNSAPFYLGRHSGSTSSNFVGHLSSFTLRVNSCGDGAVGDDEECDDGNDVNGDGCSSSCTSQCGGPLPVDLTTPNVKTGSYGYSAALDGSVAVLGANSINSTVAVFEQTGTDWTLVANLPGSAHAGHYYVNNDLVDVSENRILANTTIYEKSGANWEPQHTFTAPDDDLFGTAVALDGDTAALSEDPEFSYGGVVHVYELSGGNWTETAALSADYSLTPEGFGSAIDLDGDALVVGDRYRPTAALDYTQVGGVSFFRRDASGWQLEGNFTAPDPYDYEQCGTSVAVNGDTAVVGCPSRQYDGYPTGSALIYERIGGSWQLVQELRTTETNSLFGQAVAVAGNWVVVGAPQWDGLPGHTVSSYGAVFVYERCDGAWVERDIVSPTGNAQFGLGQSVAFTETALLAGAQYYQTDNGAYFF